MILLLFVDSLPVAPVVAVLPVKRQESMIFDTAFLRGPYLQGGQLGASASNIGARLAFAKGRKRQ